MKRGYKKTEIGEIPEEWEVTNLGSLCDVVTKGTTPTTMGFSYQNDGVNFVKVESITENGEFLPDLFAHIDNKCHESFQRSQLHEKDVLFSIAGAIGRTAIVPKWILPANTNQALAIIRLKKNFKVYPEYIVKTLSSPTIIDQSSMLKGGAAQLNMSLAQVQGLTIPLPPLAEQKKIAEVLSSVDESIRATQAVIEQAKVLKQGMLNQLLTKGIGHKKFKQTEIGEIPEEWEIVELRSCGDWKGGGTPSKNEPKYWENGTIHWVSSLEVKEQYLQNTTYKITEKAVAETTATLVPKDSLLMVMRSGILAHTFPVSMTIFPLAINQDIKALIPNSDFNSYYLLSLLEKLSPKILKECVKSGTTVQSVEFDWLKSIQIPKPSLAEQKKIGEKIKYIDDSITYSRNTLTQLARIKSGLMQDLLSGKKRVKV